MVEAGRVKLDEFHIGNTGSGAPCHGDAVSGRDIRIAGVQIDLAGAPSCDGDVSGPEGFHSLGQAIQDISAKHTLLGSANFLAGDQIDGIVIFEQMDARMFSGSSFQ